MSRVQIPAYTGGVVKLNRRLDPYLGSVSGHGWNTSGLFSTKAKAWAWIRKTIKAREALS
jgi:hypothetical protein